MKEEFVKKHTLEQGAMVIQQLGRCRLRESRLQASLGKEFARSTSTK
jgi:hypothetical protein